MNNASLTFALAMLAGVLGLAIARHLRVPGIVLYLFIGVFLGPDFANIIRPGVSPAALNGLVGFAVAIILFEGGLHMNLKKLREQATPIRRLVTIGAIVTALGGTLAAKVFMGWSWKIAFLFGTLVIVTGPTVITPLLRRLRVNKSVSTILEAEGIFIDAVGATVAVVALNVVVSESVLGALGFVTKIGVGVGVGAVGGAILALLLSRRRLIPVGLENIVGLGFAVAIYQVSHSIEHESGITAAIIAGMVVSNTRSHAFDELVEFKEQLVALLIATLFVLLTASVRIDNVIDLGMAGVATVLALIFIVRPITVAASTFRTPLNIREKAFLSWLAPRGIVAAAVASLFAAELAAQPEPVPGGTEMKALVFLVIAMTVTLQGMSGGLVARMLGVKRPTNHGYAILGANPLARLYARTLAASGAPVVLIDSSAEACQAASADGFEVILGNGLEDRTMDLAMIDARIAAIALTTNENVNFLFAKHVKELYKGLNVYAGLETTTSGVTADMLKETDIGMLFASERHLALWAGNLATGRVETEAWQLESDEVAVDFSSAPIGALLPLAVRSGERISPIIESSSIKKGERVRVAIVATYRDQALEWLTANNFAPVGGKVVDASETTLEAQAENA